MASALSRPFWSTVSVGQSSWHREQSAEQHVGTGFPEVSVLLPASPPDPLVVEVTWPEDATALEEPDVLGSEAVEPAS